MPTEARDTIAKAIAEVLSDPNSETAKFISKQYPPGPVLVSGDALTEQLKMTLEANKRMLKAVAN